MKNLIYLFFAFVFYSCASSDLTDSMETNFNDSINIAQTELNNPSDSVNTGNRKLELSNRILNLKTKWASYYFEDAGNEFESATGIVLIGGVASTMIAILTYDKHDKTISGLSFVPALIGSVCGIITYFQATSDFKKAGKIMRK